MLRTATGRWPPPKQFLHRPPGVHRDVLPPQAVQRFAGGGGPAGEAAAPVRGGNCDAPVVAVAGGPMLLVFLVALEEVEIGRALLDRLLDHVAEELDADAVAAEAVVEAAGVVVDVPPDAEAVHHGRHVRADLQEVEAELAPRQRVEGGGAVEGGERGAGEDAPLAELRPALLVEADEGVEDLREFVYARHAA